MNKIGTLDIIKAYLGNKELSANNAYVGEIPLIKGSGPEPLDKDYFYLQPLSTGNYSISSSDEVWKQNNTFEFRLDKTNWRKFSSLPTQESSVGFVEYMANNPNLVALALNINAYNTYVVGQNYRVGIREGGHTTVATFLGTDENFAYYTGTLEDPGNMRFNWGLMPATDNFFEYESKQSRDRMFEWNGRMFSGKNTNISDYSSFSVVTTIITETIPLTANDKLYLRNTSGSIHSGIINSIQSVNYNIGGILNTLTDYTDDTYTITESYANNLFNGNTHLISASDLKLPSTSLANNCYNSMFNGCTSLTEAPALPATTLASGCYDSMFYGCTSLTTVPTLPATTLARDCYSSMFRRSTALTEAPALPATSLINNCYEYMFEGCTSLTQAPELPATTLVQSCYSYMFQNCSSLNKIIIRCKGTYTSNEAQKYFNKWVDKVAAKGDFYNLGGATFDSGANGIPSGWTEHYSL